MTRDDVRFGHGVGKTRREGTCSVLDLNLLMAWKCCQRTSTNVITPLD
jgi:hypothetical protein